MLPHSGLSFRISRNTAAAGTAIQNGRQSWLGDTFNSDGNHLNTTYGCYTAACTWFETFAGETVVGNAWIPENVTEAQAAVARMPHISPSNLLTR